MSRGKNLAQPPDPKLQQADIAWIEQRRWKVEAVSKGCCAHSGNRGKWLANADASHQQTTAPCVIVHLAGGSPQSTSIARLDRHLRYEQSGHNLVLRLVRALPRAQHPSIQPEPQEPAAQNQMIAIVFFIMLSITTLCMRRFDDDDVHQV